MESQVYKTAILLPVNVFWLSKGNVLNRFSKVNNTIRSFTEERNELSEKIALLCDNMWLFDLKFLVDVTSHINDLISKLQIKNKLLPSLVISINAFKMKLNPFITQLENKD